jgi:hypothetical protein
MAPIMTETSGQGRTTTAPKVNPSGKNMNDANRRHDTRPFWGWETLLALAIVAVLGGAIFNALWNHGIREGRRQMTMEDTKVHEEAVHASAMENELKSLPLQDADRIIAEAKQRIDRRQSGLTTYPKNSENSRSKKPRHDNGAIPPRHQKLAESGVIFSPYSSIPATNERLDFPQK